MKRRARKSCSFPGSSPWVHVSPCFGPGLAGVSSWAPGVPGPVATSLQPLLCFHVASPCACSLLYVKSPTATLLQRHIRAVRPPLERPPSASRPHLQRPCSISGHSRGSQGGAHGPWGSIQPPSEACAVRTDTVTPPALTPELADGLLLSPKRLRAEGRRRPASSEKSEVTRPETHLLPKVDS